MAISLTSDGGGGTVSLVSNSGSSAGNVSPAITGTASTVGTASGGYRAFDLGGSEALRGDRQSSIRYLGDNAWFAGLLDDNANSQPKGYNEALTLFAVLLIAKLLLK